jgi:hypothetical protein
MKVGNRPSSTEFTHETEARQRKKRDNRKRKLNIPESDQGKGNINSFDRGNKTEGTAEV